MSTRDDVVRGLDPLSTESSTEPEPPRLNLQGKQRPSAAMVLRRRQMNRMLRITDFPGGARGARHRGPAGSGGIRRSSSSKQRTVGLSHSTAGRPLALSGGYDAVARDGHVPSNRRTQLPRTRRYPRGRTATLGRRRTAATAGRGSTSSAARSSLLASRTRTRSRTSTSTGAKSAMTGSRRSPSTHPDNHSRFVPADTTVRTRAPQDAGQRDQLVRRGLRLPRGSPPGRAHRRRGRDERPRRPRAGALLQRNPGRRSGQRAVAASRPPRVPTRREMS